MTGEDPTESAQLRLTLPGPSPQRRARLRFVCISLVGLLALGLVAAFTSPALANLRGGDVLLIRKDVKTLTAQEKAAFTGAILKAKSTPAPGNPKVSYYDQFVEWHRNAFLCKNGWQQGKNWAGAAHNSPTFLPWHRELLIKFEQMLRTVSGDRSITAPYWDWTDPESTAAVFADDFMGGDGDPNQNWAVTTGPFRKGNWALTIQDPKAILDGVKDPKPYLVRHFNIFLGQKPGLPTKADVREILTVSHYDHQPFNAQSNDPTSFRNSIEGWRDAKVAACTGGWVDQTQAPGSPHAMHNLVHIYTGGIWKEGDLVVQGTMAYNASPNDPVFFLHHANVDRIWAAWELEFGNHYRPQTGAETGYNGTDTMWPWFDRSINSWFGTLRNGYRYERLPSAS